MCDEEICIAKAVEEDVEAEGTVSGTDPQKTSSAETCEPNGASFE